MLLRFVPLRSLIGATTTGSADRAYYLQVVKSVNLVLRLITLGQVDDISYTIVHKSKHRVNIKQLC